MTSLVSNQRISCKRKPQFWFTVQLGGIIKMQLKLAIFHFLNYQTLIARNSGFLWKKWYINNTVMKFALCAMLILG